ncbi:MAG: NAD-dependent epimerase/dehydratase family protein [Patescibacteria group bacterium]|nr:NAD-dependent epimerase/dehydratase family protein [Patescibacteria group bacterium]
MAKRKTNNLVLVTGGAGFVGSHLVDGLIASGYRVRVLDNLRRPTHTGGLPAWFNKKAQFVRGDVDKKSDWEKALKDVSYIFHLAGYMDYRMDFSEYVRANAESAALLYEVIVEKRLPVKKVIVASSQAVYGEGKYVCRVHGLQYAKPRDEKRLKKQDWAVYCACGKKMAGPIAQKEDDELMPTNPYAITKRALEELALMLGREYSIPTVVLRYAIVHGSRQTFRNFYSGALRAYAVQALAGERIEMHEDGHQIRDFVHIDDAVAAHMVVLKSSKANYEIFNVGSGRRDTVMDLAKTVAKAVGVRHNPLLKGVFRVRTTRHSLMDVSKLKRLGWRPKKKLEDNVRDYVAFIKGYPEAIRYLRQSYRDMAAKSLVQ